MTASRRARQPFSSLSQTSLRDIKTNRKRFIICLSFDLNKAFMNTSLAKTKPRTSHSSSAAGPSIPLCFALYCGRLRNIAGHCNTTLTSVEPSPVNATMYDGLVTPSSASILRISPAAVYFTISTLSAKPIIKAHHTVHSRFSSVIQHASRGVTHLGIETSVQTT